MCTSFQTTAMAGIQALPLLLLLTLIAIIDNKDAAHTETTAGCTQQCSSSRGNIIVAILIYLKISTKMSGSEHDSILLFLCIFFSNAT
jgi:hypothetical protein